jgi:hypothetical protein
MMRFVSKLSFNTKRWLFFFIGILAALFIGFATFQVGLAFPVLVILLALFILLEIVYFQQPKSTLYVLVSYCFIMPMLAREIGGPLPYGTLIEVFLGLSFIVAMLKVPLDEWSIVKGDLFYILLGWFILSFVEVANPAGAAVLGWLQEIRSAAVYPLLIVILGFLFFNTNKDLNNFLKLTIIISVIAALNGIKQLYIGPSPGEQRFLDEGGQVTHILFGKLRVFSFYGEAGQFGASMAHFCVMSLVLALGPFKWWKKMLLVIASAFCFYGMLISGTRGALFALVVGIFVAIILTKNVKVFIIGGALAVCFLCFLKFTTIGNGNYQILRLRSALDPSDPSLNVRKNTQRILTQYMSSRPFGGGLGVLGAWGEKYNQDKFLSTIPPDSYWVKIWAMYGIVGFTIWLGLMMYILGKCCGIVWRLEDPGLRIKTIALTAGFAGILMCSYGNEVINTMPSSIVVYLSWVFVFISPKLEENIKGKVLS